MKRDQILSVLNKYKSDSVLFTNSKEIFYITNVILDGFWVLFLKNKTYVICQKIIKNQIKIFFRKQNLYIKNINSSFYKTVTNILKQNKISTLLVDIKYMNAEDFILISKNLNHEKIKIVIKIGILDNIRLTKSTNEIKNLKTACKITSKICNIIKHELIVGISEIDIHYRIIELFAKNHVIESFNPIIAFGINSANPHHKSSNRKLIKNDIIVIDIGCRHNNYCSDITRTYFIGEQKNEYKKIWNIVKKAHDAVLKKIKQGVQISLADKTARDIITTAGYKKNFIHSTGHGIGIEIHELPSLSSNTNGIFLKNMVVTIEPGIYINNKFGVRIEDTVLINKNNSEVLTSAEY
ncbi:MAG: aminopeptidase P family protein [Endomicrobium sp.]|jgi:Xaa-Pro aminopeptidase|nr:aminopeptidase P family protein [Endomicrobium sp.]